MDGYNDGDNISYTDECPICGHPLDKVYYGGGTHKWECEPCGKYFVTEITNKNESE
jgi:transposase-like protein